ncbi:MAG: polysaccharide biosynthesis C-terminal domain-containing protein, partial [Gaiellales bacterium]
SLPLARLYGATGAAGATVIVEFVLAIAYGVALRRTGEASLPGTRTYLAVAMGFAAGLACAFVPGLPSLVSPVIAVLIFGIVVLAFRILPRELLDAVPHPFQRLIGWGMR